MPLFYHLFYTIAILLSRIVRLWARWQIIGRENVPRSGPLLVVANHMSLIDIPMLGFSLGRKARFMAKEELFRSKLAGWLLRGLGSFPVYRGRMDIRAIRQAQSWLARGGAIVVFPEGTRSRNGRLQPALSGSIVIASRTRAPVLPVGIYGTEKVKNIASALSRPKVVINIGCLFYLPEVNSRLTREKRAELTKFMMQHIAELLPPEYRGNYAIHEAGYEN